ncbi:MAG TPA: hydantoinase/oxoprolinase family protein, partial [Phototrophicaceae bacterium]|nr:hydantoinase/oxoprolinase family protein [Phototrophicaceae bacterium]
MLAGVDIGGTFTDLVLSVDGRLVIHKLLSTPGDPSQAMLAGLNAITAPYPGGLDGLVSVAHGSTVATNAILERKGAKIALITTQGFRDVLFIGRQNRPKLYELHPTLPPPLVPRERCHEVPERLEYTGKVLTPLDLTALDTVLDTIAAQEVEAVAVCLLYSFVNPSHEHAIRDRIRERGFDWQVALSSDVLPEFREYERTSATVLEAYVRPVMSRYVSRLQTTLQTQSTGEKHRPLRIMKSDGGVMNADRVASQAIQTALSGPAAGVIGAFHIAQLAGFDHIITLDMGGTSTDVALCPGELVRRPESKIDHLPLRIRLLDIETVGAGGGSLARVDAGGALRVGPESAGADPGPIIYGRGGSQVTVSDANAVLNRLNPERFLGGKMRLDIETARLAMEQLSQQISMDTTTTAAGILEIANANIERAVRRVSVERGYDPREFTLVAFGGAGGLHACAVAERLGMTRILIPRYPGVLCAFGLLVADVTREYSQSVLAVLNELSWEKALQTCENLIMLAQGDLATEGFINENSVVIPTFDLRYQGQAYELTLQMPLAQPPDIAAFHALHQRTYGFALPDRPVEIVNVRVQAVGRIDKPVIEPEPLNQVQLSGQHFEREELTPGASF